MNVRKIKDNIMKGTIVGIASFNIVIVFLIFMFILRNSLKFFNMVPASDFFFGKVWINHINKQVWL